MSTRWSQPRVHRLRFDRWVTQPFGQKAWYVCRDCGAGFSEPHPTDLPPVTDCPARKNTPGVDTA